MVDAGVQEMCKWATEWKRSFQSREECGLAIKTVLGLQRPGPCPGPEESDLFKITLAGFRVHNDDKFGRLQHLTTLYDWRLVMSAMLEAVIGYKELSDMEPLLQAGIHKLISSHQGFELLSSCKLATSAWEFQAALLYTHYHWHRASGTSQCQWHEATMGQRTFPAVFKHVKKSHHIDLSIPDVEVSLAEMGSWDEDGAIEAQEERRKALSITFRQMEGEGVLVVSFVMEKKEKVSKFLEDLAAVAVARQMANKSHTEIMEFVTKTQLERGKKLPKKLFGSIQTVEWVQSHRLHILEDKRRQLEVQESAKY